MTKQSFVLCGDVFVGGADGPREAGVGAQSLENLKNLQHLALADNQMSGVVPMCVEKLVSLQMLILWENRSVTTLHSTVLHCTAETKGLSDT